MDISSVSSSSNRPPYLAYHVAFMGLCMVRSVVTPGNHSCLPVNAYNQCNRLVILSYYISQASFLAIYVAVAVTFAPTDKRLYIRPFEMPAAAPQRGTRPNLQQEVQQQDIVIEGADREQI